MTVTIYYTVDFMQFECRKFSHFQPRKIFYTCKKNEVMYINVNCIKFNAYINTVSLSCFLYIEKFTGELIAYVLMRKRITNLLKLLENLF